MEHTTRNRLGSRIKARRRAKGLTALELARRVGITENAIRKLESGDSKEPRLSTALLLADALDVNPDFVCSRHPKTRRGTLAPELGFIIRQIRQCQPALNERGVEHVSVFGSVARGDARCDSDVDIIIDPAPTVRFSLFDLVATREILESAVHCRVDVVTGMTIRRSAFADAAAREAVNAF
jgi:predicted nucleotidyltransferase/DNA-binding Xre family transcriptional regulator